MKKIKIVLLLSIVFVVNLFAQKPDLIVHNLNGKIKLISQEVIVSKDTDPIVPGKSKNEQFKRTYNPNGFLIKEVIANGEMDAETYKYKFFPDFKIKKLKLVLKEDGEKVTYKYVYTYDDKGFLSERNANSKGIIAYTYLYKYDLAGNLIEQLKYKEGKRVANILYKYDDLRKVKEIIEVDNELHQDYILTYDYDEKGNIRDASYFKPDRTLNYRFVSKYDEHHNELEVFFYLQNDKKMDAKFTYTYEYDKNANWISKIETKNGKVQETVTRKIEYYNL